MGERDVFEHAYRIRHGVASGSIGADANKKAFINQAAARDNWRQPISYLG